MARIILGATRTLVLAFTVLVATGFVDAHYRTKDFRECVVDGMNPVFHSPFKRLGCVQ